MNKVLIVVDMQNDFIDGTLGSEAAVAIVDNVVNKIVAHDGLIFVTYDTHFEDYLKTSEGKKLPIAHCIKNTEGWQLNKKIESALKDRHYTTVQKNTFGSTELPLEIKKACGNEDFELELVGLCTDICVVSNAIILKANFPEVKISVDSLCCAGVTEETHQAALQTMKSCQIDVY